LWIADASLMPSMPASDLHLTALLIAHRLASWLNED
jgi:choline dehydrogenase-like flavoprotein